MTESSIILEARAISRSYTKKGQPVRALDHMSLTLHQNEIISVIGESGSGKSTLLRILACLEKPSEGQIFIHEKEYTNRSPKEISNEIQMIFQDAVGSFDPHLTIRRSLQEVMKLHGIAASQNEIDTLMQKVGLQPELADRKPGNLSGGQCQRAAIARGIIAGPSVLLCDEITSALDVSAQAQIIRLLMNLRDEMHFSILFVSHDLALVSSFCDRTYVLQNGKCVEVNQTEKIIREPQNEYTKTLISSVMIV